MLIHHASEIEEGNQLHFPRRFLLTHFVKFSLILTLSLFAFAFGEGIVVMNPAFVDCYYLLQEVRVLSNNSNIFSATVNTLLKWFTSQEMRYHDE